MQVSPYNPDKAQKILNQLKKARLANLELQVMAWFIGATREGMTPDRAMDLAMREWQLDG